MNKDILLLGVDRGGTRCRARLRDFSAIIVGEVLAGPANTRLRPGESVSAVLEATAECVAEAGPSVADRPILAEPARFLGLDATLGRLAPGFRADMVCFPSKHNANQ